MTASLREIAPSGSALQAALLRRLLQLTLKPVFHPARSIAAQRRRVDLLGGIQPLPRGVRREVAAGGEWLRPAQVSGSGSVL